MRKFILFSLLTVVISTFIFNNAIAQYADNCPQSSITVENVVINGSDVTFDIFIVSTIAEPNTCWNWKVGNTGLVIDHNVANFNGPTLSLVPLSSNLFTIPALGDGQIATQITGNNLLIDLLPILSFETVVGNTPVRFGSFMLTGFTGTTIDDLGFVWDFSSASFNDEGESDPLTVFETVQSAVDPTDATEFEAAAVVAGDIILKVDLTRFNANKYNRTSSHLFWQTATEENADYFQIERTLSDEPVWEEVGRVPAKGNSSVLQNYTYIDEDVYKGLRAQEEYLYRLKIVDIDGRYEYSNIEAVRFSNANGTGEIEIFPNPATDGLHIQMPVDMTDRPTDITIYDVVGKMVYSQAIDEKAGYVYVDFATSRIESGSYLVQFSNNSVVVDQKKIIVQR